tara:strand:+ start:214 stop:444 length:231 start_codon:yes stop_codon:yes gene_type:complete
MLNELLFTLFLTQVGTVAAFTACIVGVMGLFYAEIVTLDKCDVEELLQVSTRHVKDVVCIDLKHAPNRRLRGIESA